jgi:hypothetical protein
MAPDVEKSLREKLLDFSGRPRFKQDVDRAIELYFGKAARRGRILTAEEEELPDFFEWFIHDMILRGGKRLIDLFAEEVGPQLPKAEARLLDAWRVVDRLRLFEVQSVQPGVGVVVQDVLSGETLTVHDRSASRAARRWVVMLARLHQAEDRVCFTGAAVMLPPQHAEELVESARRLWDTYRSQRAEASYSDFYRDHSLELMREAKRATEEASRPPVLLTPEGHPIASATAHFTVRDPGAVAGLLSQREEFEEAGPSDEDPEAQHFNWLLRGQSRVPERPAPKKGALMIQTEVTFGPGEPAYRSLGDVLLWGNRMELRCLSRERLQAGKALLQEILGDLVRLHKRDRIEPFDLDMEAPERVNRGQAPPPPARRPSSASASGFSRAERQALEKEMRERYTAQWLNTPIPALNDLSPRQAVATPEGRAKVIQLLKSMEYLEDGRRESGEPMMMDIARLRRELGLPPA